MSDTQVEVQATYDKNHDVKEMKFHFKKDELGNKRETVELKLPVPSVEGVIEILQKGGKGLELLLTACADVVAAQARSILNDNDTMMAENFDFSSCSWEFISNMPEAEKRGRGIAKEVWEAFASDYVAIMPGITGKSIDAVSLAAKLFLNKFQSVKTNKPVIEKLKSQLGIYLNATPNAEQFLDCVKFLDEKAIILLQADETALLANL